MSRPDAALFAPLVATISLDLTWTPSSLQLIAHCKYVTSRITDS